MSDYKSLDSWIAREAIPFTLDSRNSLNAAVDQVMAVLGERVQLLGFGEALHGGEEILILRNRMFQRLAERHGFTAIALESSFPRTRIVNDYVCGKAEGPVAEVAERGFSHNFGKLATSVELIEWTREYNTRVSDGQKLHCYGFDSPTEMMSSDSPRQLLRFALNYLRTVEFSDVDTLGNEIDSLIGDDSEWQNPEANMDPSKSIGLSPNAAALRLRTEDLITQLQVNRPAFVAKTSVDDFGEAMRHATHARQMLNYHAGVARQSEARIADLLAQRDAMMADNLAYIVRRERRRAGRVLVFAHNSHLKRGRAEWQWGPNFLTWWPAGAQASTMLGEKYAVVGSAVGTSDANGIGAPEAATLEARLTATPTRSCFIPTHLGAGLPESEIAALPSRTGSRQNGSYFPLSSKSFTDFDWFVTLDSVCYHRGGPPLPS